MDATFNAEKNTLTIEIDLLRKPIPSASGKVEFVAKESGVKFGARNTEGKPFVGNLQIWLGK